MRAVLDEVALLDRIDHDLEFLTATLEVYNRDRSELMYQVREAVSQQDGGALADAAHTLIGLARNFSAEPVLDVALKLEIMAERGEFSGAEEVLVLLEDETTRLKNALQGILHQGRNSSVRDRGRQARPPMAEHPIRVITIDDQEIMRGGIRFMLRAAGDIELVGEAANVAEGIRLCNALRPDVVLMDMKLPDADGIAATRAIKQRHSETQVLVLTAYHNSDLVKNVIQAGAVGYVQKDVTSDELAQAIRASRAGRSTFSSEAASALAAQSVPGVRSSPDHSYNRRRASDLAAQSVPSVPHLIDVHLTERERQVLALLAKGMRNNQIAKQLNRSPYTIRHHVSELIAKFDASNRAEVAAIAVKNGLVD